MTLYPIEYYEFFVKFNEGDYYTCHDLLEHIWMTDKQNMFLKGLLQMTVSLYHYGYGNVKGARIMMEAGCRYIQPYRPFYWGVDLEKVNQFMEKCLSVIPLFIEKVPFKEAHKLPQLPQLLLYLNEE